MNALAYTLFYVAGAVALVSIALDVRTLWRIIGEDDNA